MSASDDANDVVSSSGSVKSPGTRRISFCLAMGCSLWGDEVEMIRLEGGMRS